MSTAVAPQHVRHDHHAAGEDRADLSHLRHVVEHAAHLLPAQGPITVFIHHNTLHAFEDMTFIEGVKHGARVFGCQPFLTEKKYRDALRRGRIRFADLEAVLRENLGPRADAPIYRFGTRLQLRRAMLVYPLRTGPTEELLWFVAETDALRRVRRDTSAAVRWRLIAATRRWVMRDLRAGSRASVNGSAEGTGRKAPEWVAGLLERFGEDRIEEWDDGTWEAFTLQVLWAVCRDGVAHLPPPPTPPPRPQRHRELLLAATGADSDAPVHALLTRFCAAFLDQGLSHWPLPHRDEGFLKSFSALYGQGGGPPDPWLRGLAAELARMDEHNVGPLESIRESLDALGVPEPEWDEFLGQTLLALRGWGGIVRQVELRADSVAHPIPEGSLVEFLAVRLLLDRLALAHTAREALGYTGPLGGLRDECRKRIPPPQPPSAEQRAFAVFQLAQVLDCPPSELHQLDPVGWEALVSEIEAFGQVDRRETFHLAYERRFQEQVLDALALHAPNASESPRPPRFQVVTCLDEREESFRRHLEEVAPECETFGVAGFYGVAMYYQGAADAHPVPLCPIVIKPRHWVTETVDRSAEDVHRFRSRVRRALGMLTHRFHTGSRTFLRGAALSLVGAVAAFPLVARILFPRLTAHLRKRVGQFITTPPATRLQLERTEPEPGPEPGHVGYTVAEMTDIAERLLRETGLAAGFARLVFTLGHGSHSMNNPHESAHDCGACGGGRGGPNGRAVAQMLNDPRVRAGLAARGLPVPDDTHFVGGLHNTCNEYVKCFDLDRLPVSHRGLYEEAHAAIEEALGRNAHERARRFGSAPLSLSFAAARHHMDARAEDLAQVRPEWGHATNAICVVGRRSRTRGLFLDRRAFLTSYDPTRDDADASVLTGLLRAVFPVCGGINLEYYFGHVDCPGYGCGTKLPHNITSLLGVMDGAASDLRTGLPWQMVEIHEPVRLLIVIETTPEVMTRIMDAVPMIGNMARKGWVQLAVQDPRTGALKVFVADRGRGEFRDYAPRAEALPRAPTSLDWYRGCRDHLEFAVIGG
jgi:uncharacterized protein YbcC (UPF0753/DUF2309 family)